MPTIVASGTLVTSAAEQTLVTPTASGVYMLMVDFNNMVAGDHMVARCKRPIVNAGAVRTLLEETVDFYVSRNSPLAQFVPMPAPFGCTFTLQQPIGAARSIPWQLVKVGEVFVAANSGTLIQAGASSNGSVPTGGSLVAVCDLNAMTDSDVLLIQGYGYTATGGLREVFREVLQGVQSQAIQTLPIPIVDSTQVVSFSRLSSVNFSIDISWEVVG